MAAAILNEGSRPPSARLADSDDDDSVNRARVETGCSTSVGPGWRIPYSERHIRYHGRSSSTFLRLSRKLSSLCLSPLSFAHSILPCRILPGFLSFFFSLLTFLLLIIHVSSSFFFFISIDVFFW